MTIEQKLAAMRDRLHQLENKPINTKCPGVKRKLARQIKNLEAENTK